MLGLSAAVLAVSAVGLAAPVDGSVVVLAANGGFGGGFGSEKPSTNEIGGFPRKVRS